MAPIGPQRNTLAILLAALLLVAVAWAGWAEIRLSRQVALTAEAGQALSTEQRDRAQALARGIEEARAKDQSTISLQGKALKDALEHSANLGRLVARSAAANGSLLDELNALRERTAASAADPRATEECKAAGEAVGVLTGLLGQCSSRRRAVAIYAQTLENHLDTCERYYDALRRPVPRLGAPLQMSPTTDDDAGS